VDVEWGRSVDLDRVEDAFRAQPDARALLVTHSETSTGALHDLEGLARIAASRGALVAVDAITSLLVHDLAAEDWSLDIVVSGSQKALMAPPGMSFLCVSPRALDAARRSKSPRCYFDVIRAVEALAKGDTPWTPAITTVLALAESCALIRSEGGVGASVRRHARIARAVRAAMRGLGLRLLAAEPSNALTAVVAPDGIDTGAFVKKLDHDFGVRLAGGQGRLKGRVFRIGHMGFLDDQDLLGAVHAIESTFAAMGCALPPGGGIGAMRESLRPGDGS
jgi:aspartate aminotransferase-like enzyme